MFLCLMVSGASQTVSSKHVLIMDEVDGMAGNEDRGGIQVDVYTLTFNCIISLYHRWCSRSKNGHDGV